MKKTSYGVIFFMLLIFSSCANKQNTSTQAKPFQLQEISTSDFETTTSYSASVQGQQDIEIYPQVSGYLERIAVTEGEVVKQGDLLFVIQQAPFLAAYNAAQAGVGVAQAAVATAQLNYDNSAIIHEKGIVSDSELQTMHNQLESAKAGLCVAEAELLSAKTNLDFTMIKSPSDGVVGKLPYRKGTLVSASLPQSLTVISDNSNMYVYFSMNEEQIYDLFDVYGSLDGAVKGMPELELKLSNGTIYAHKGRVESISGVIDSSTGSVSVRASFPNPQRKLLSGSTANLIIPTTMSDVVVISKTATYELQGKFFTYRVIDGVAKSTPIEISATMSANEYVVLGGLTQGDVIIAKGAGLVREGTPVKQ
ncbi:MAG: efflux RND transporter periplasmic adaptor subunit [Bacteroidales bacterium]